MDKELKDFLCKETVFGDLGNENILHEFPAFGRNIGEAINSGNIINFSKELSSSLDEMDLYKASLISNFIGFACEKEEDTSAGQGVIELLAKSCINLYNMFNSLEEDGEYEEMPDFQEIYNKNPDWARAYYGFNILCVSAMAFLTRDTGLRKLLEDKGIEEEITYLVEETPESPYLKSIYYVSCILKTCSGLKLLVLHTGRKKGFFATASDLNNCFHLLYLLEEQIAEKFGESYGMSGFDAASPLIELAHGAYPDDCWDKHYNTHFMECNYSVAGSKEVDPQDAIMSLVWGEMPPDAIPAIDGYAIIILMDTEIHRGFDAGFLATPHSALKPCVHIEKELDSQEYNEWKSKIEKVLE